MSNWAKNKAAARFKNTAPTKTDQSAAAETDINVIVDKFLRTGQAPRGRTPLPPDDYSQYPEDFRGFLEMAKSITRHRAELPPALQKLSTDELLRLTPAEITAILTPAPTPTPTPAPAGSETK